MRVGDLDRSELAGDWAATSASETVLRGNADRRATILTARSTRQLVELAEHLPARDRALIRAIYVDGITLRVAARLRRQTERVCRRRLEALVLRISSPTFALTIRAAASVCGDGAPVARAHFIEGLTVRETARRLRTSIHAVRRERLRVLAMADCLRISNHLSRGARKRAAA